MCHCNYLNTLLYHALDPKHFKLLYSVKIIKSTLMHPFSLLKKKKIMKICSTFQVCLNLKNFEINIAVINTS